MSRYKMRFKNQGIHKADRKEVPKLNTKPDPKIIMQLMKTNFISLWKSKPCRLLVVRQRKTRITLNSSHTVLIQCLFKT